MLIASNPPAEILGGHKRVLMTISRPPNINDNQITCILPNSTTCDINITLRH